MLDKKDFEVLFRNEFRRMTLFAMRYVKDFDTAREIVQESFLGLWEKRTTINPEREVKSYLSTSVRNRSLNYLRDHNKFDRELIALEGLSHDAATEANPDIELSELRDRIDNAVDELPEKCREVFLFNRNEHMKYQEIAELLGISVKTVEAQMSKALAHLRQRLKEYLTILILFLLNA
ncbi:MAG: RNA polymerase sigma-70 factor [Bacteroidetes bacterium]|nr:RNA polymerase sigma-70 factor [Bacteroidota bacterium]